MNPGQVAEIDAAVSQIITPVYRVGGSVRDALLGRLGNDLDYATPLDPDAIEAAIRQAGRHPYLVGKRFGTVGVRIDGVHCEITTFRSEQYAPGSRKPEVAFVTDIAEDLGRRDFTVNAMAWKDGEIIDPFGGQSDLEAKVLRAVGKPAERFAEDPLRLIRLARFAAQLGFSVEEETLAAAKAKAHTILNVSRERWTQELDRLLMTDQPSLGLEVLAQTRVLVYVLPEIALQVGYDQHSPYHQHALFDHTKRVVDGAPQTLTMRWTALLHDIGKPFVKTEKPTGQWSYTLHDRLGAELVEKTARYLKWGNERRIEVVRLVAEHMQEDSPLRPADHAAK